MSDSIICPAKPRILLRVGISLVALSLAVPSLAADMVLKAPALIADPGEWRTFVEGGTFWTGGDPIPYTARGFGILGAFPTFPSPGGSNNAGLRPNMGWDAAAGWDHRFAGTPWHVNMQARWGEAQGGAATRAPFSASSLQLEPCCNPPNGIFSSDSRSTRGISTTSAELNESHWQADFGMGYDYLPRLMQVNFGVRVAGVTATTTATTNASATTTRVFQLNSAEPLAFVDTDTSVTTALDVTSVRRSFFGAGPRVGLQGWVPLIGPLTFDYSGDAALLFGNTKISSASSSASSSSSTLTTVVGGAVVSTATSPPTQSSLSNGTNWSSSATVYNFDVQAGLSWWFTPALKLGLSYRLDAFIDPLRSGPDGDRLSRLYHGPKLTLSGKF